MLQGRADSSSFRSVNACATWNCALIASCDNSISFSAFVLCRSMASLWRFSVAASVVILSSRCCLRLDLSRMINMPSIMSDIKYPPYGPIALPHSEDDSPLDVRLAMLTASMARASLYRCGTVKIRCGMVVLRLNSKRFWFCGWHVNELGAVEGDVGAAWLDWGAGVKLGDSESVERCINLLPECCIRREGG